MGSYKWSYKSLNMGYNYSYATYKPLITTHEPPSRERHGHGTLDEGFKTL